MTPGSVRPRGASPSLEVRRAEPAERGDWDAYVAAHPAGDPLQAWGWGEVAALGGERPVRLIARDGGVVVGVAQLLVRATSFGRSVIYVPHGPLWGLAQGPAAQGSAAPGSAAPGAVAQGAASDAVLDLLLQGMGEVGREERGVVVKVDPRATPGAPADAVADALLTRGLRRARADLQARMTRLLDLRAGPDALFAELEKDTRNLVRRAAREGVTTRVVLDGDRAAYATFATLLAATAARARFRVRSGDALARLAAEFGPAGAAYLVLAELSGRAIAGGIALTSGDRAFYLYAASVRAPELRHANAPYATLWALCEALAADGRRSLDLWGVVEPGDQTGDPEWLGFSLFKRGFGGTPLRHPGTFDLVLSPLWFRVRDVRERLVR